MSSQELQFAALRSGIDVKLVEAERLLNLCRQLKVPDGKQKLQRKLDAEKKFLLRLKKNMLNVKQDHIRCSNLFHLSLLLECASNAQNVTAVLKPFGTADDQQDPCSHQNRVIVDVIADYGHTWIKVVARNPLALLQASLGTEGHGRRTILDQAKDLLHCAHCNAHVYKIPTVKMHFAYGICSELKEMLEAVGVVVTVDAINDNLPWKELCNIVEPGVLNESELCSEKTYGTATEQSEAPLATTDCFNAKLQDQFSSDNMSYHFTQLALAHDTVLNLDVSTMIAYVSALTNGSCELHWQDEILNQQARSERLRPVKLVLESLFRGRMLVCCQTAYKDFCKITDTVGGMQEKERAFQLLGRLKVVPDHPSAQALSLCISAKIKHRSLVIFGTGDTLKALTVSANGGFIRSAKSQGIRFVSFVHESRALAEVKQVLLGSILP